MKRRLIIPGLSIVLAAAVLGWANQSEAPLAQHAQADLVVVEKSKRELIVYRKGKPLRSYKIALGRVPLGPKQREGDGKTPEGQYLIDYHKPDSAYFRALHISYPSPADVQAARKASVSPGGAVMIHGLPNGLGWVGKLHRLFDWTLGCVAVTNPEMEELWRVVPDGTRIVLNP